MRCALGVRTTEIEAYCAIINGEASTVQEVAKKLGKSRSTAQRLLQNLVEKGLARRKENLIGLGGYQYLYNPVSLEDMKRAVKMALDLWYEKMLEELESLPEKLKKIGRNCIDRYGQQRTK